MIRATVAACALAIAGCCALDLPDFGPPGDPDAPPPSPSPMPSPRPAPPGVAATPGGNDLGVAVAPPGTPSDRPTVFSWQARRPTPATYRASYRLSDGEHAAVLAAVQTYARSVGFRPEGNGDRFFWTPPRGCEGDLHCVFEALAARSRADVDALEALFRARTGRGMTSLDAADLLVTFVQSIRYEVPKDQPFGVLAPATVLAESRGDCDSKALLLVMMLRGLGLDAQMVSSDAHRHTMVGVALPVQGTTFTWQGRKYAFTETTATGWPIGQIDRKLLSPSDWRVVPVR